jgi:hypothetical protein
MMIQTSKRLLVECEDEVYEMWRLVLMKKRLGQIICSKMEQL